MLGLGAKVQSLDFDDHPLGPLDPEFFKESYGITFTTSGSVGDVKFGEGPGQTEGASPKGWRLCGAVERS